MTSKLGAFYQNRYKNYPADWEFRHFGDLFRERREKSVDTDKYPLYSLLINGGVVPKSERYERRFLQRDKENNEYRLVHKNDIVFNPMNLRFGAIAVSQVPFIVAVSAYYNILSLKSKAVDIRFIGELLRSPFMVDLYDRLAIGSLVEKRRVHLSIFENIIIPLPPLDEQRKIAEILSTWDEAIAKTECLLAALREHKKGLMQILLTGKIRFAGFNGKWKEYLLGKTGAFSKGAGISKADLIENGIPCIRYGELYTTHHFVVKEFHSFITPGIAKTSKPIYAGDILFSGSGETAEEIGKCVAFVGEELAYAGGDVIILRLSKGDPIFMGYLLNHETIKRQKYRLAQGHSVVHIYERYLKDIKIPFPPVEEQQTIAKVLQTCDEEIDLHERKLSALKQQKKGLMQRLLTGEVRVSV